MFRKIVLKGGAEAFYPLKTFCFRSLIDSRDILKERYSYGLQLNIDWFQPFSRRKDVSIGAINMCLLNLPIEMRYK